MAYQPAIRSTTTVRTSVSASTTVVTILAANTARKGATLFHHQIGGGGSRELYLAYGSGATATDFSDFLPAGASVEVPFGYTGIVTGIWVGSIAQTFVRVTEFT